ncbi:chitinase 1-like, partial [Papaver somniferum]|uniref:chitinase 1-like n=1 Tax=Papaver somniferum TaxID=3469 RepID=UPI000E6F9AC3
NSVSLLVLQAFLNPLFSAQAAPNEVFREYIGAEFNNVKFTDVPVNPNVEFHFILSFAIDYTTSSSASPTNGNFNVFWDSDNLSPSQVSSIKKKHSNVKVAVSLGGDSVGDSSALFNPSSVESWVQNAVSSLTECIGQLLTTLKGNGIISFASIAPFDDDQVQSHYQALWSKYGHLIDYVNFQFYAYDQGTSVSQFLDYFQTQTSNYNGGKILPSFGTDSSGGLSPENGFFTACSKLRSRGKLHGIFIWSADDSKKNGFRYEK